MLSAFIHPYFLLESPGIRLSSGHLIITIIVSLQIPRFFQKPLKHRCGLSVSAAADALY